MAAAGITLEQPERSALGLRHNQATRALRHLMSTNCGGRYSYNIGGQQIRAFPIEGCDSFEREMLIISIEGHDIVVDGDLVFQAVAAHCTAGGNVKLGLGDGETLNVPCTAGLRTLLAPLGFPIENVE